MSRKVCSCVPTTVTALLLMCVSVPRGGSDSTVAHQYAVKDITTVRSRTMLVDNRPQLSYNILCHSCKFHSRLNFFGVVFCFVFNVLHSCFYRGTNKRKLDWPYSNPKYNMSWEVYSTADYTNRSIVVFGGQRYLGPLTNVSDSTTPGGYKWAITFQGY
jgi:hypothetical protein